LLGRGAPQARTRGGQSTEDSLSTAKSSAYEASANSYEIVVARTVTTERGRHQHIPENRRRRDSDRERGHEPAPYTVRRPDERDPDPHANANSRERRRNPNTATPSHPQRASSTGGGRDPFAPSAHEQRGPPSDRTLSDLECCSWRCTATNAPVREYRFARSCKRYVTRQRHVSDRTAVPADSSCGFPRRRASSSRRGWQKLEKDAS
jgi:hypothetical protein